MGLRRVLTRGFVIAAGVGLLTAVSALPGRALTPERKRVDDSFSFTNHFCSFPIRVKTKVTGTQMLFFDEQGNVLRDELHLFVYAIWRNPDSNKSVIESDHVNNTIFPDGSFSEIGLNFRLSLAGGRTVLIDAGRLVFDDHGHVTFEAGNHQVTDGHFGALCAALR